jgi:hypothetical protein
MDGWTSTGYLNINKLANIYERADFKEIGQNQFSLLSFHGDNATEPYDLSLAD